MTTLQPEDLRLLRSRAERHLAYRLYTFIESKRSPEIEAARVEHELGAEVSVFLDLGVFTKDDADSWQERFRRALRPASSDEQPPEVRASAIEVLQGLWAEVEAAERPRDWIGAVRSGGPLEAFAEALFALRGCGAITAAQMSDYEATLEAWLRGTTGEAVRSDRRHDFAGIELLRVLPGPSPNRGGIVIASVELYRDGVVINYLVDRFDSLRVLTLAADAGGDYALVGQSGCGGRATNGRLCYAGAAPAAASKLAIEHDGDRFAVDLHHSGSGSAIT